MTLDATAIILAGGQSRRMGRDKAALPWDGSTILNHMAALLQTVCREVIVVSNIPREIDQSIKVVADVIPNCGPLSGIHAGLYHASFSYSFVIGCDMPFLTTDAVKVMLDKAEGYDAVIPIYRDKVEPLFAVYGKSCMSAAEHLLNTGVYRIVSLYPMIKCCYIDETQLAPPDVLQKMFKNLNTVEDYQQVIRHTKGR